MRFIIETMGTVASVDGVDADARDTIAAIFADIEARFSLYQPESELSRITDGRLSLMDASAELRETYAIAMQWSSATSGSFTPNRPDGVIDLNGVVKAIAMARAGHALELRADTGDDEGWSIAVGGDILFEPAGTVPRVHSFARSVGIADPTNAAEMLAAVTLTGARRAIATSGTAQRGEHIWLARSTAQAEFVQATVIADDILTADVLATAIIAGGSECLDDIVERWSVDVLTVDRAGALRATPGLIAALAPGEIARGARWS